MHYWNNNNNNISDHNYSAVLNISLKWSVCLMIQLYSLFVIQRDEIT